MPSPAPARTWRFGDVEFDESRWEFRLAGERRAVEAKPLALLHALLCRAGEAVTKAELMDAVWPGVIVVEGSLTTAVSKLRMALGEHGRTIIEAVHGIGYRIGVPTELHVTADRERFAYSLRRGDAVPNRQQWLLERDIAGVSASDVWLARHEKTGERRVFKFADTANRLLALRREADLARVLTKSLGERPDFLPVLEWNFEARPYFIEMAYGGLDLSAWVEQRGGLAALSLSLRVGLAARVARTVGAAHGAGVLHRDIKPANILVAESGTDFLIRLVDFGSGRLIDAALLASLSISGLAVTADPSNGADQGGLTLRYMAPELLTGGLPSIAADVYALGILLYELVIGDLERPMAAGWEADIPDPLLREDIAAAAAGDPARRLSSALLLAKRLDSLEARRAERQVRMAAEVTALAMAARIERHRARRPWLALTGIVGLLGLAAVSMAEIRAVRRGNDAARQAAIAQAVNRFLTDDLLARGDPERSGRPDETLMEAAGRAEVNIDKRFANEPFVAGSIHLALAEAFDRRTASVIARNSYVLAVTNFLKAQGANSPDAAMARLRLAIMEARSQEEGSKARAQKLMAAAQSTFPTLGARRDEAQAWLAACQGLLALGEGRAAQALSLFTNAADLADTKPDAFDESRRLWLRQNQATSLSRLGKWAEADKVLQSLLPRQIALHGPMDADTLLVKLTIAQVLMGRGQSAQAVTALNQLYPQFVAVYGGDHSLTAGVLMARAQSLGQLGRYDEAIRDDVVLHQLAISKRGDHSWAAIATLSDVAESQCRAGHGDVGLAAARQATTAAEASFGATSVQAMAMRGEVAFCLIIAGHASEAAPLIDSVDAKALSQIGAGPDFPAQLDVMRAAIALAAHDAARARALLKGPSEVFARADADPYIKHWVSQLKAAAGD